jgi:hypothetical protein
MPSPIPPPIPPPPNTGVALEGAVTAATPRTDSLFLRAGARVLQRKQCCACSSLESAIRVIGWYGRWSDLRMRRPQTTRDFFCHGTCSTAADLLPRAVAVIKHFMARDPDEVRFTILALAPNHQNTDDDPTTTTTMDG